MKTIHVLWGGRAVCGYGVGKVPGDWPAEHRWMRCAEIESEHVKAAIGTGSAKACDACVDGAKKIKAPGQ